MHRITKIKKDIQGITTTNVGINTCHQEKELCPSNFKVSKDT